MTNGLFKYFSRDTEKLEWFINGLVLLTPPEYFNDPWDFAASFEAWGDPGLKEQCPFSSSFDAKQFKQFREAMTGTEFRAGESRDYQKQIGKIIGVLCLTEKSMDRLMWAHYAESHCGFVAEFRHDNEETEYGRRWRIGPFGVAGKVSYPKYPKQPPTCKRDLSNITEVLWTKHSQWEYEQEWRVVQSHTEATPHQANNGSQRSLLKFEPCDLHRVIFGLRVCQNVEARLKDMLKRPEFDGVQIEKADIDPETSELISRKLTI